MNTEREIFSAALERDNPGERAAFLDSACAGQPALRARIEALLCAAEQAGEFLADTEARVPEGPGTRIDGYRLGERIGEGGFGVIYRAEQDHPVRRTVALKIIKLGMDTRAVIARFEAERQALARMEHPHIARVLDAGATEAGRPYFVMELVRGVPITAYCDDRRLDLRGRLEIFLQVCRAVHHAHQKGVIHRDLKPSNILVTEEEGKPAAKVIDFGIAKATREPLTDQTLTRLHGFLGTPAYMSPEQVGLDGTDVDTRSDIYSLGALLYELLAGAPAFEARTLSGGYAEVQRVIQHVDPVAPAQRVAALEPPVRRAVAERRRVTPAHLMADLQGDLDRIVLKCLDKNRDRRYETTEDLARDVMRYLQDEPVLARPATLGYRIGKFTRRHQRAVFFGTIGLGLLAGSAVYHTARLAVERDRAQLEARKAAKVSELLTDIVTTSDPYRTPTQQGLLEESAVRVRREFADEPAVRAEILNAIGRVYLRRGEHDKAAPILEEALAAARALEEPDLRLAQTLSNLGVLREEQGDRTAAVALLTEALALRRQILGNAHNEVAICLVELARVELARERFEVAEPLFREALEIRQKVMGPEHRETAVSLGDLAVLLWQKGDLAAAEPLFLQSLAVHRKSVGPAHPNVGHALGNLALLRMDQGNLTEAETLLREGAAILQASFGAEHWRTARIRGSLAEVWRRQGRLAAAGQELETALQLARAGVGPDRPVVASLAVDRARVHLDLGEVVAAEALLREALRVQRLTGVENGWRITATKSLLGRALAQQGQRGEAERWLTEASQVLKEIPGPQGRETAATRATLAQLHTGK